MVSRQAFFRLLSSYLLLLGIPLGLGTVMTSAIVGEYEERVQVDRLRLLNQAQQVIEGYIEDVKWQTFKISGNARLARMLTDRPGEAALETLFLKQIVDDLNSYLLYSNSLNSNFYLLFRHHDIILTPYSVYDANDFQDGKTYFRMEGVSTQEWHRSLFDRYLTGVVFPARTVTFEDFISKAMIPYVQSLPLSYAATPSAEEDIHGVIVYLIGNEEFTTLLEGIDTPAGGFAYISDSENTLLTGLGGSALPQEALELPSDRSEGLFRRGAGRDELFVTYTTSETNGWHYVAAAPSAFVFSNVRRLQVLSFVAVALSLAISGAIAVFLAYHRSELLGSVFAMLSRFESGATPRPVDFRSLNHEVSRLIDSNVEMQADLRRQRELLDQNFLNRLWHGYFADPEALGPFQLYVGDASESRFFSVVSVRLFSYGAVNDVEVMDELEKTKVLFRSQLRQMYPGRTLTYDPEENILSAILASSGKVQEDHEAEVQRVVEGFMRWGTRYYPSGLAIGIGTTTTSLTTIHRSYQRSKEALPFAEQSETRLARFSEVAHQIDSYSYPIEIEIRLMNATRSGDVDAVTRIMEEIHRDSFVNRALDEGKIQLLLYEIRSTLSKLMNQVQDQELELDWQEIEPPYDEEAFESLKDCFLHFAREMDSRKRSHNSSLIKKVRDYITESYADHNLGLTSVAERFRITESYLSYFFKEQTGTNFSTFVESTRIRAAEELLVSTQMPIAEVAGEVGYNSDKTFRRVFRRLRGLSPTEFRREEAIRKIV